MMDRGETRFLVDLGELKNYNTTLAQNLQDHPADWLPPFDKALAEKIAHLRPDYGKENKVRKRTFCPYLLNILR